jgi:hypothetical protein
MAPTKANAIQTTSTFNLIARFADMDLLAVNKPKLIRGQVSP